jgi:cobalamin biosynthesis Mg chelatase CobN
MTAATLTVAPDPAPDPAAIVAGLARHASRPAADRRVVLVLDPDPEARAADAAVAILGALDAAGYRVAGRPDGGGALAARLAAGPTGARPDRPAGEIFPRSDYAAWFAGLPRTVQDRVTARWGAPERDPFFREGRLDCGHFAIPALWFGNAAAAVPPGGAGIAAGDGGRMPVPAHADLAFYAWIADGTRADAVIRVGRRDPLEAAAADAVLARIGDPDQLERILHDGPKGVFELVETVDYLFAFAAMTRVVRDDLFGAVEAALLEDETVRGFLTEQDPHALAGIAARLAEAARLGLWHPADGPRAGG